MPTPEANMIHRIAIVTTLSLVWPLVVGLEGASGKRTYLKASNTEGGESELSNGDLFGFSIAISGDTLVVGASEEDSGAKGIDGDQDDNSSMGSGAAYVFVRGPLGWTQQAYLKPSNTGPISLFGSSVAISGDTIVVGAPTEDSGATGVNGNQFSTSAPLAGAAYVFVRNGSTWSQQAYLKASNTDEVDLFGSSVAISGDVVVVGARNEDSASTGVNGDQSDNSDSNSGAAYAFVRSGTSWSQEAYLKATGSPFIEGFGEVLALSGNTLVVGASRDGALNTGAAFVFARNAGSWTQEARLTPLEPDSFDYFGGSVSVSGDTVVVGATHEDSAALGVNGDESNDDAGSSGAAYVFERGETGWSQAAYLKASNAEEFDYFGASVAIDGESLVVGATFEDSSSSRVHGDQDSNDSSTSGAAYLFRRSGPTWVQVGYLKASNTGSGDLFGSRVALGPHTVMVTALAEDSSATGIDGDGSDNSANDSGAVYLFERTPAFLQTLGQRGHR